MIRTLLTLVIVLALLAAAALAAAYYLLPGEVDRRTLGYSVGREAGAPAPARCRRVQGGWTCRASRGAGHGASAYRVTLDGDCWRARRSGPSGAGGPLPRRLRGCVRLWDELRIGDRLPGG